MSQIEFFGSDCEHSGADRAFGTRKREPVRSDRGRRFGVLEGITEIKGGPAGRCDESRATDNVCPRRGSADARGAELSQRNGSRPGCQERMEQSERRSIWKGWVMAGRGPQSFKKRQKEQQRKEKQQEKLAKRRERQQSQASAEPVLGQEDGEAHPRRNTRRVARCGAHPPF